MGTHEFPHLGFTFPVKKRNLDDEIEQGEELQRKVSLASWRPGKEPQTVTYINWETRFMPCQE